MCYVGVAIPEWPCMTKAFAVTRALYAQAERMGENATRDRGAKTKARWPIDGSVGLQLRRARLAKKLTVDRLSADLGVTVEQYEKFEAGLARIGATRLHKLAAMLQVPPVYFFEDVLGPYSPEKIAGDAEDALSISEAPGSQLNIGSGVLRAARV